MREPLPNDWQWTPLSALADVVSGGTPSRDIDRYWGGEIPWVTPTDITRTSGRILSETAECATAAGLAASSAKLLPPGTLLMTSRATIGEIRVAGAEVCTNQGFKSLVLKAGADRWFLYYQLLGRKEHLKVFGIGSTFLEISKRDTERFEIPVPPTEDEQRSIANVLASVDNAIEQTESLIAKYQQIKAGLMHDLFTRGVDAQGRLRPPREEAPELYKPSPLGWIPKAWDTDYLGTCAESLADGPFGSNLKSEHYVEDAEVRVVRLQNIQSGMYDDSERAFVSASHAKFLQKNEVIPGDILIAALGEDRYPVGRACLYPDHLGPAINKADCFRLRCWPDRASNGYVMLYLNTEMARKRIVRYQQGVTRQRINTGNLRRIEVALPPITEQAVIVERVAFLVTFIEQLEASRQQLEAQRSGLMSDLLSGRVRIPA